MNAKKPRPDSWLPLLAFPGVLIVLLVIIVALRQTFPLPVEHSAPQIVYHGTSFTVEMDVTNHTKLPVTEVVGVQIGSYYATRHTRGITPLDQREIPVSLAPSEVKHLRCEFPNTYRSLPNVADARVLR